jgi:hypothetical protein
VSEFHALCPVDKDVRCFCLVSYFLFREGKWEEDQRPGSVGVTQLAWSICTSRYPAGNGFPLADDYLGFCRGEQCRSSFGVWNLSFQGLRVG